MYRLRKSAHVHPHQRGIVPHRTNKWARQYIMQAIKCLWLHGAVATMELAKLEELPAVLWIRV